MQDFQFIDPGPLTDGELEVVLTKTTPADPARAWLPDYTFEMRVGGEKAGRISLRIGNTMKMVNYCGHIGYAVEPQFRGHHYAERACRLVLPIAKAHGQNPVWIMCNPSNIASRRTLDRLGAELVEIVRVPLNSELYEIGDRESCRYRVDL